MGRNTTESTRHSAVKHRPCVTVTTLLRTLGLPQRSTKTSSSMKSDAVPSSSIATRNEYSTPFSALKSVIYL